MSSLVCDCDDAGLTNTGAPSCIPKFGVTKKIIMVPLTANDGTLNSIDLTATIDAAYINAKINHADSSKRWYPISGDIKNVAKTKSESTKQTYDDGSIFPIQAGVYSFTGIFPNGNQVFAGILNSSRCTQFGIFEIDANGSLRGYTKNEVDILYPTPVNNNTWEPIWNDVSDTVLENTTLNFQFDSNMQPEYLQILSSADITGISLLNVAGLVDVLSTNVSCSTTVLVVKLRTKYNTPVKGLVIGDFYDVAGGAASKVYNVTDSAALALTSVVESPSGTYTLTMTVAQTVADKIRVTPVKTGFDYTAVIANTATVA